MSKNPSPAPEPSPLPPAAEANDDMLPGPPLVGSKFKFLQLDHQSLWTHQAGVGTGQPLSNGQGKAGTCLDITCIAPLVYRATGGCFGGAGYKAGSRPDEVFFVDFASGVQSAALLDNNQKKHEPQRTDPKVSQLLNTVAALSPEQRKSLRDAMAAEPSGKAA